MATQNEILLKAVDTNTTITSTVGASNTSGILKPAQASRFIDFVVDQSVVMQNSRFVRMRTPDMDIDKLAIGTRLLSSAAEADTTNSTNVAVTFSKVALTTKKMRLDWAISTESLEDNLEGAALEDHIAQMMARQTANDLDDLLISGNASGSGFVAAFDGFIRKAISSNTVGRILSEEGTTISRATFDRVLRGMPSKYLQRRNELRFFAGSNFVQDTIYSLSNPNSATAPGGAPAPASTLGDMAYMQGSMRGNGGPGSTGLSPYGIPLIEVPLMPETIAHTAATGNIGTVASTGLWSNYGSAGATANVANHGYLELTFPNNRIVGVHRDITVYRQFKPKTDMIEYTQFMRVGCAVENADAYVLATNIKTRT